MEAIEFLESAKELLNKPSAKEIDYRNAASRAYYCAFHACKKLLEDYPASQRQIGTEHDKTIRELLNHQNKQFKILGNMLQKSKDQRHRADYKLIEKFSIQDGKFVITQVNKILMEINK